VALFKSKGHLLHMREVFRSLPTAFVDVSIKMQQIADDGGMALFLNKDEFDPNAAFGNPSPGTPKILEVSLDCQGHDAERLTESNEMMDNGYARNFITVKKGRFNIVVEDEPLTGKGCMETHLEFRSELCTPVIIVTRATYGEVDSGDASKLIDVTNDVQGLVQGRTLLIERDLDLNAFFRWDPSPGKRKQLQIHYVTKGFTGNLRVREKNDGLVAAIELGYPPLPPPDDKDYVIN